MIEAERQLTYEGGRPSSSASRSPSATAAAATSSSRAREAQAGENQKELQLTGDVKLASSDGFIVKADTATLQPGQRHPDRAPGAVDVRTGRMTGSGIGMTYDKNADVLSLAEQSHVLLRDEHGNAHDGIHVREVDLRSDGAHALRSTGTCTRCAASR